MVCEQALCDYPEVYAVPGDPASRGVMFLEEAKSQLSKVEDFSSVPTIQGLAAFSVSYANSLSSCFFTNHSQYGHDG